MQTTAIIRSLLVWALVAHAAPAPAPRRRDDLVPTVTDTGTDPANPDELVQIDTTSATQGYCHNFLDPTTNNALVYDQIDCWLNGTQVSVWDFGSRSQASDKDPNAVAVNPIYYPVYPSGISAGAPVIDRVPCDDGYSDVWLKIKVTVQRRTVYNSFKEISAFDPYALFTGKVEGVTNMPIVPKGSILTGYDDVKFTTAWYKGRRVTLVDLGIIQKTKKTIKKLIPYQEVDILDENFNTEAMILENGIANSPNSFYVRNSLENLTFTPTSFDQIANLSFVPLADVFFFNYPIVVNTTTTTTTTTVEIASETETPSPAVHSTEEHNSVQPETKSMPIKSAQITETFVNAWLPTGTEVPVKVPESNQPESRTIQNSQSVYITAERTNDVTEKPLLVTETFKVPIKPTQIPQPSAGQIDVEPTKTVQQPGGQHSVYIVTEWIPDTTEAPLVFTETVKVPVKPTQVPEPSNGQIAVEPTKTSQQLGQHSVYIVTEWIPDTTEVPLVVTETVKVPVKPTNAPEPTNGQIDVSPTTTSQQTGGPHSVYIVTEWIPDTTEVPLLATETVKVPVKPTEAPQPSDGQIGVEPTKTVQQSAGQHSVYIVTEWIPDTTEIPLLVTETVKVPIKPTQIPQPSNGNIDVETTKTVQQTAHHSVYIVTEWIPDTTEVPVIATETVKVPVKPTEAPQPSNGQIGVEPTKTVQQPGGQHSVYIVTEWIPDTTEAPLVVTETVKVPVKPTIIPEPTNGQIDVSPTTTSQQTGGPHSVYIVTEWIPDTTEVPLLVTETVKVPVKPTEAPVPSNGQIDVGPTKTVQQPSGQHSVYIVTEWIPDTTEVPLLVTETAKVPVKPTQIPQPTNGNVAVKPTETVQQPGQHSVYIVTEWIPDTTEAPLVVTETAKVPVKPTIAPEPSNGQIDLNPTKTSQQPGGPHSVYIVTEWIPDTTEAPLQVTETFKVPVKPSQNPEPTVGQIDVPTSIPPVKPTVTTTDTEESPGTLIITETLPVDSSTTNFDTAPSPTQTVEPIPSSSIPQSVQHSVYIVTEWVPDTTEAPLIPATETFKHPPKPTDVPQPSNGQINVEPTKTSQQSGQHSVYIVTEWIPESTEVLVVVTETIKAPVEPTKAPQPGNGQGNVQPTLASQPGQHSVYIVTEWVPDTTEAPLQVTETVKVPIKPTNIPQPSDGQIGVEPTRTLQPPGQHSVYVVTEWVPDTTEAPLLVTETVKVPVKPSQNPQPTVGQIDVSPQPSTSQIDVEPTKTVQQPGQHSVYIVTEWIPDTTEVPLLVTETVKVPVKPTQAAVPSNGQIDVGPTKTVQQPGGQHSVYIATEWIPDTTEAPLLVTETAKVPVKPTQIPQPTNGNVDVKPTETVQQPGQHSVYIVTEWIPDTTEAPLVVTETVKAPIKPTQAPEPSNGQIGVEPTRTIQQPGQHSVYIVTEWIPDSTEAPLIVTETLKVPVKHTNQPQPSVGEIDVTTKAEPTSIITESLPLNDTLTEAPKPTGNHSGPVYYISTRIRRPHPRPTKRPPVVNPSDNQNSNPRPTSTEKQDANHPVYVVTEWVPDVEVTQASPAPVTTANPVNHSVYVITEWIPDVTEATPSPAPSPPVQHPVYYITQRSRKPRKPKATKVL